MIRPATPGEIAVPTRTEIELRAPTATIFSFGSSVGSEAINAAIDSAPMRPSAAANAYTATNRGSPPNTPNALAARPPNASIAPVRPMMIMMRRSYLSARIPPMSIPMNVLMPVVAVAPPTCADDLVSSYIWIGTDTISIPIPTSEISRAMKIRRNGALSRRGERSISIERSGTQVSLAMLG